MEFSGFEDFVDSGHLGDLRILGILVTSKSLGIW
jgi:hypothetical protein